MPQTSYAANMTNARKGQIVDCGFNDVRSCVSDTAMTFGLLAQKSTYDNTVEAVAALPSADVDAIAVGPLTTTTAAQTFSLTSLDGVFGDDPLTLAQRISFVLNSHGDWDATWFDIVGYGSLGQQISEKVPIPNSGNTTIYTLQAFKRVERIRLDAQTGTNGSFTVGTDPTVCIIDPDSFPGVVCYDPVLEPYAAATEVPAYNQVSILSRGRIWVAVEDAVVAGSPCYVRMVVSGGDLRGQFRGTPAANFFPMPFARFVTTQATAGALAVLEIGG